MEAVLIARVKTRARTSTAGKRYHAQASAVITPGEGVTKGWIS
jgi:hypothetical protein